MLTISGCQCLFNFPSLLRDDNTLPLKGKLVFKERFRREVTTQFFDRHGGLSKSPFQSLNVSFSVGDDLRNVVRNRAIIKQAVGVDTLVSAKQVHGDNIYHLKSLPKRDLEVEGYDAIITQVKNVGLVIQQADCQGVLLYDKAKKAVAAIHCGWRGSVEEIIRKSIVEMQKLFSTDPNDLQATISPSLGPCCGEFKNYSEELPEKFHSFQVEENYFDFWRISKQQLLDSGLQDSAISISGCCTSCSSDYFSYRRARRNGDGITGRNCSVIVLR